MTPLRLAAALALVCAVPPFVEMSAQALPPLRAAGPPGAAGLTLLVPGTPTLELDNPARVATFIGRTFAAWQTSSGRTTELVEQTLGLGWSPGRAAGAVRLTTRSVDDLFDDSTLAVSGLEVADMEVELVGGAALTSWLSIGGSIRWVDSKVLGTRGSGHGSRFGLIVHRPRWRVGISTGDALITERWSDSYGNGYTTEGDRRTSAEAAFTFPVLRADHLAIGLGHDRTVGPAGSAAWKGSVGLSLLRDHLSIIVGGSRSAQDRNLDFLEAGIRVTHRGLALYGGTRSGAEPAPGRIAIFGVSIMGARDGPNTE
jgi:hypothetical protein